MRAVFKKLDGEGARNNRETVTGRLIGNVKKNIRLPESIK
jgi:hypothetical protein